MGDSSGAYEDDHSLDDDGASSPEYVQQNGEVLPPSTKESSAQFQNKSIQVKQACGLSH